MLMPLLGMRITEKHRLRQQFVPLCVQAVKSICYIIYSDTSAFLVPLSRPFVLGVNNYNFLEHATCEKSRSFAAPALFFLEFSPCFEWRSPARPFQRSWVDGPQNSLPNECYVAFVDKWQGIFRYMFSISEGFFLGSRQPARLFWRGRNRNFFLDGRYLNSTFLSEWVVKISFGAWLSAVYVFMYCAAVYAST